MQTIAPQVAPTGLRERPAVDTNDVGGVIEPRSVHERGADAVHVDGNSERFEAPDLVRVESTGRDDANVRVSVAVQRLAQQLHEPRGDAAQLPLRLAAALLELAEDRAVDEGLAGVDPDAPETRAQRVRDAERGVHHVVLEVDEAREVHVALGRALRREVADGVARAIDEFVELERRHRGIADVDRYDRVRHWPEPRRAPPLALLVGRDADRAADVRRVARARLRFVRLMARTEHDHRLAVGRLHDVTG